MLVAVFIRSSDMCGNSDTYGPLGYIDVPSMKEAEKTFPNTPCIGYVLQEVKIEPIKELKDRLEKSIKNREYR